MNAHVRSPEIGWDLGRARAPANDARALSLAARLARVILDPFLAIEDASVTLSPLPREFVERMTKHPSFAKPVRRAASSALGLDTLTLSRDFFERLTDKPSSRLCILLVTEPADAVRATGLDLAAAILHRRIVGLVLKGDRARVRTALGDESFQLATQEASMLHSCLAEIDKSAHRNAAFDESAGEGAADFFVSFGLAAYRRFIETCEPQLRELFDLRWPALKTFPAVRSIGYFAEAHCDHLVKLLRRRAPSWSAIIG